MRDVRTSNGGRHGEPAATTGSVIAGKYQLCSVLGQGGMGTVWRAEHLGLGAPVAVKLIDPKASRSADALRLCQKEASAAAALRSPHVVQVLDFGVDDTTGSPFIVMELLDGESLADRLLRLGKLAPADTARILTHIARALSRAHEVSILHRDLKPANVFLVRNEDEELAKVLDFGTARVRRTGHLNGAQTPTGAVVGTPFYMSPEHITGQPIDHRTDLWAMAVMTFECLTGRRPFDANDIGPLVLQICSYPIPVPSDVARVPAGFDAWFARATERDIEQRFTSARELVDDLRRICGGAASGPTDRDAAPVAQRTRLLDPPATPTRIAPATPGRIEPASRPRSERALPARTEPVRRGRVWWIAGAAAVIAAGVVAIAAPYGPVRRPAAPPPETNVVQATPEAATVAPTPPPAPVRPASPPPAATPPPTAPAVAPAIRAKPVRPLAKHKPPAPPKPTAIKSPGAQPSPMLESVLDHRR